MSQPTLPTQPQPSKLDTFLKGIRGKLIVLYGMPLVGKSYFCVKLSKCFNKPYFIWVDTNLLNTDYGNWLKKQMTAEVLEVKNPTALDLYLRKALDRLKEKDFIVLDSITGIQEAVMAKEGITSPRVTSIMSRMASTITYMLSLIVHGSGRTGVFIAHELPIFAKHGKFIGEPVAPAFTRRALKNCDAIWRMYIDEETNERILKCVIDRSPPDKYNLTGVSFPVNELLKGL